MKPRLLISLILSALLLASCYRQAEEPFQQVDSAEVVEVAEPTSLAEVVEVSGDTACRSNRRRRWGRDDPTAIHYA